MVAGTHPESGVLNAEVRCATHYKGLIKRKHYRCAVRDCTCPGVAGLLVVNREYKDFDTRQQKHSESDKFIKKDNKETRSPVKKVAIWYLIPK